MRKTYQTENAGYVMHPRLGVEHLSPVPTTTAIDGSLTLEAGAQFRSFDPQVINRFDHMVELGNMSVVSEEPDYMEPAPEVEAPSEADVEAEKAAAVEAGEMFVTISPMVTVVELGKSVIRYMSPDMEKFVPVSGSLAIHPGVKLAAGEDEEGARILAALVEEKIIEGVK
jgi:hypothetical protein